MWSSNAKLLKLTLSLAGQQMSLPGKQMRRRIS